MPPPALGMVVSMEDTHSGSRMLQKPKVGVGVVDARVPRVSLESHAKVSRGSRVIPSKLDVALRDGLVQGRAGMGRGRRVEAILSEFPEPSASQLIVRVSGTPGSNLLRVEDASGCEVTVRLPSKTKNTIWVRTGGFLIINVTTDVEEYGDVAHFLYKDQIRYLQTRGLWPAGFASGDRSDTHREAVRKLALQPYP